MASLRANAYKCSQHRSESSYLARRQIIVLSQRRQPAISLVTTLCVALVGLFPASLWADCCCTLPKTTGTTACTCCVAVPESCCGENATSACHTDPASPDGCSCQECGCDPLAEAPLAPQPRDDSHSRVAVDAAVLASVALLPVNLDASSIAGFAVPVDSAYSRPVRELFCVWVI